MLFREELQGLCHAGHLWLRHKWPAWHKHEAKVCERADELSMQRFSQNLACAVCAACDESDR